MLPQNEKLKPACRVIINGSSFFPLRFIARALRAWANRGGKNSVRNLRYGPRTQLVRGMYCSQVSHATTRQ